MMFFLNLNEQGILIASIFWGLWLFPIGTLIYESRYFPKIFGHLMVIAGFGYLIDFFTSVLFPNFDATVSQYMGLAELVWPLWFLIKGVNVEQWEKRALDSA